MTEPAGTTDQSTSAPDGATSGSTDTGQQQQQSQQPATVSMTQDELNQKFGDRATQARLKLAKDNGYETIEAMNAALKAHKENEEKNKTEMQRLQEERDALKTTTSSTTTELQQLKLEREAERAALALGANPQKLDAIMRLRDQAEGEIKPDGTPDKDVIKASVEAVLNAHTYFKGKGPTVGGGSNPADGATETLTIDQQIQAATKKGDANEVLRLQMAKLFVPAT